jgi:hypothetical protein
MVVNTKAFFQKYYREHDIKLEKTISNTPQQNRMTERMNIIIVKRIRCMLSHVKLSFWFKATKIIVVMINFSLPFS